MKWQHCNCEKGYEGRNCHDREDCKYGRDPCKNDGTCENLPGSFKCTCKDEFVGPTCQDTCNDKSDCQNEGVCEDQNGVKSCKCVGTGYEGKKCEINIDECNTNQHECINDGICQDDIGSYHCDCEGRFDGSHCETPLYSEYGIS